MRNAHAARRYIVITALLGGATAVLVVVQAVLISRSVSSVVASHAALSTVAPLVGLLALVMAARTAVLYAQESLAHRAATRTIIQLRRRAWSTPRRWDRAGRPSTAPIPPPCSRGA